MRRAFGLGILILLSTCVTTMAKSVQLSASSPNNTVRNLINRFGEPQVVVRHPNSTLYIFKTTSEKYNTVPMSPQVGVGTSTGRPVIVVEPPNVRNRTAILTCTYYYEITYQGKILRSWKEGNGC